MPNPERSEYHRDQALTAWSLSYAQDQAAFVALQASPPVASDDKSALYFTYDKAGSIGRGLLQPRKPGSESDGFGYDVSQTTFVTKTFSLHHDIDFEEANDSSQPLDPYADATELLVNELLVSRERHFGADVFAAANWTNTVALAGADQWTEQTTSNPFDHIKTARLAVSASTGKAINAIVCPEEVFEALKIHPDIIDRVKYTSGASVGRATLAALFEVDRFLVGGGAYNSANEGATASYGGILGKHMLLAYIDPTPNLKRPSALKTFYWQKQGLQSVSRIDMPWIKSTRVELEANWVFVVTGADLGYFIADAVA